MKKIKFLTIVLVAFICVLTFASCKQETPDPWPDGGLALQLPTPDFGNLDIGYDGNNSFSARLKGTDKSDYEKYLSACKAKGFTSEPETETYEYTAFNEEGYKLRLYYFTSSSELNIDLDAPIEIGDLKWPIGSAGKAVPEPSSKKGKMDWEHEDSFLVYVGNTTLSDYNKYVDKCIDAGFVVDYTKGDKYYRAKNSDGYSIDIEYEGFNIMRIRVDKKTDEQESDSSQSIESISESSVNSEIVDDGSLVSDTSDSSNDESQAESSTIESSQPNEFSDNTIIRTEVKEAIDSYEAFIDQYCEFLLKYDSSDMEMLNEYMEFLQKEIEVSKKFEDIKDMDLNDIESDYYTTVQLRCSKKMLDTANKMESR